MEGSMNFRMMSKVVKGLCASLLLSVVSVQSIAGEDVVNGTLIDQLLLSFDANPNGMYGGCMMHITSVANTNLTNCDQWLSLDCNGNDTDVVRAYRMYDQAQLAFTAGKRVLVVFNNDRVYNGVFCTVNRLDIQ
jgi:hypothetical protein